MPRRKLALITPPKNVIQYVFRWSSTLIVHLIAPLGVSPNQVTLFRAIVAAISLGLFIDGNLNSLLWAVILFYVFEILDHVDGDLARHTRQSSVVGRLLEQFVDTWASRPSNVFGLCVAIGMFHRTDSLSGPLAFGFTVLGRMMWLEYRHDFGWKRVEKSDAGYTHLLVRGSPLGTLRNVGSIAYVWQNTLLILSALADALGATRLGLEPMVTAFWIVAALNNAPWIAVVIAGFGRARREDASARKKERKG